MQANPLAPSPLESDFSVVIGGPLFQALRRAHLAGDALQMVRWRVIVIPLLAWLPLLLTMISVEELLSQLVKVVF